jgi:cellulose synthase/poly-beta-1,6-N-acetylglucosamine synthase-like glycosyltransferase
LESLVAQEAPFEFDIIVIDGGSTDHTKELILSVLEKTQKILFFEYKSSQPAALNFAVRNKLVRGNFIAFIDGDCLAPKDWLQKLVVTLHLKNTDAVGGPGLTPHDVNTLQKIIGFDLDTRFLSTPEGYVKRHPNMNLLIRKEVFEEIGFNEAFIVGYDTIFGYILNARGYKIWYNPDCFVWHYHRSSIRDYFKQQFVSGQYALKVYLHCKNARKGDNINSKFMLAQPILMMGLIISLAISIFYAIFHQIALGIFLCLSIIFLFDTIKAIKIAKNGMASFLYFLYFFRVIIWLTGTFYGVTIYVWRKKLNFKSNEKF